MPSVLAICDLRRRIRRHMSRRRIAVGDLTAMLALDPPAVLRGIRAASAPAYGAPSGRWTVARLVQTLGRSISLRLSLTDERGVAGTSPIRHVWMRSIGTACAAQVLAEENGLLPPDEAYLLGLVHALPTWMELLYHLRTGGSRPTPSPSVWTDGWNLPAELAAAAGVGDERDCDARILALLDEAQRLAELAGFLLEGAGPDPEDSAAAAAAADLVQRTRQDVDERLRRVGLDFTVPDFASEGDRVADASFIGLGGISRGTFDELTVTLLSYTGSATYRGIITALTAAAVRNGGYDRACYAKWCHREGSVVIRAKADLSSRRIANQQLAPNESEIEAMRTALEEERPVRLEAGGDEHRGILGDLSVDELLFVPLNASFETPSFLLLDRSLSLEPIRLAADGSKAQTLSLAGTLLIENLLLRKRRERAQKFASTDGLTHLLNRTMGMRILDQEIARAARSGQPLTVLLCDLDRFKSLNDTYGHLLGDQALRVTAEVLRQTLRRSDSISRFGGEEFLVVLPETTASDALVLAARVQTAIEERGRELGLPLTISIGLAASRFGDTWETILHRADQALYASKDRGRNRFAIDAFDDALPLPQPTGPNPPE